MKNQLLRSSGFSLIELMITVAIISLLAGIAVPNFKAMHLRAKINVTKANLSSLYAAEKAFYAEYGTYSPRLDAIGYSVEGRVPMNIGFDADNPPPPDIPQGTSTCLNLCGDWNTGNHCAGVYTCEGPATLGLDGRRTTYANTIGFEANAHAHFEMQNVVGATDGYTLSIDSDKQLIQIVPAK